MYPKTLVYPCGENDTTEFQLEMIRARQEKYQCQPPQEEDNTCDMDMTEACPVNITLNVPVVPSVEKGKKVLQLMQKSDLKGILSMTPPPYSMSIAGNRIRSCVHVYNIFYRW